MYACIHTYTCASTHVQTADEQKWSVPRITVGQKYKNTATYFGIQIGGDIDDCKTHLSSGFARPLTCKYFGQQNSMANAI